MKLMKAVFKNFRLLKDLTLDFSTDIDKPLTVIRAANETGKTTCEYALMWGLYGSSALPKKGNYSLFPADMKKSGAQNAEISVEIEFSVEQIMKSGRGTKSLQSSVYRLRRSCIEVLGVVGEDTRRQSESSTMFRILPSGTEKVDDLEAKRIIDNALPESLKDVYFTDGDSAMSFIEAAATQGVKRKRVSNAVESLLGIDALNSTIKHLDSVSKKFGQEIDDTDYKATLESLNDKIDGYDDDIKEWEEDTTELESQKESATKDIKTIRSKIEEALKLGDKEKLVIEMKGVKNHIVRDRDNIEKQLKKMSSLASNKHVSKIFIGSAASKGIAILKGLNKRNQLPKANIPVLEELLDSENCFCGADLSVSSKAGIENRAGIEKAVTASRESDAIWECATSLFYRVRSESFNDIKAAWTTNYADDQSIYQNNVTSLNRMEEKYKTLDLSITNMQDSMLNELKDQEDMLTTSLSSVIASLGSKSSQIRDANIAKREAEDDRVKIEKKSEKTNTSSGKLTLSRHVQSMFVSIIDRLKKEELQRVSNEMNRIFLEMIGSDPEGNDLTLITEARLTDKYDIVVFGPNGHQLNPDQDLNGASRRAITLAFILALTKVSEVEAPNVIDTPLGMMSGFVKQSVLLQTIKEGSQAILFLTHDEIKGVEPILDRYAGKVYTLTNPAHYPRMLKNDPEIKDSRIIKCSCDHHSVCNTCERIDAEVA
jgi:DNA sulfur modification protein DndD